MLKAKTTVGQPWTTFYAVLWTPHASLDIANSHCFWGLDLQVIGANCKRLLIKDLNLHAFILIYRDMKSQSHNWSLIGIEWKTAKQELAMAMWAWKVYYIRSWSLQVASDPDQQHATGSFVWGYVRTLQDILWSMALWIWWKIFPCWSLEASLTSCVRYFQTPARKDWDLNSSLVPAQCTNDLLFQQESVQTSIQRSSCNEAPAIYKYCHSSWNIAGRLYKFGCPDTSWGWDAKFWSTLLLLRHDI